MPRPTSAVGLPTLAGAACSVVALALAVGVLLAAPAGAAPGKLRAAQVVGTWTGEVVVDEGLDDGYSAEVTIRRNKAGKLRGRISYDIVGDDDCTGVWRFKGKRMGAFTFKEVITVDPLDDVACPTPVAVRVAPTEEGIDVEWRVVKSGDVATMSATAVPGRRGR